MVTEAVSHEEEATALIKAIIRTGPHINSKSVEGAQ